MKTGDIVREKNSTIPMKIIKRYRDIYINTRLNDDINGKYVEVITFHSKTYKLKNDIYEIEELVLYFEK